MSPSPILIWAAAMAALATWSGPAAGQNSSATGAFWDGSSQRGALEEEDAAQGGTKVLGPAEGREVPPSARAGKILAARVLRWSDLPEEGFSLSGFLDQLAGWPVDLAEAIGGGALEVLLGIPRGLARGVEGLLSGDPLALAAEPLRGAANAVWDAVTLPIPLVQAALKPVLYAVNPARPPEVRYLPGAMGGHLLVQGGLGAILPEVDLSEEQSPEERRARREVAVSGSTLSRLTILSQRRLTEEEFRHELAHAEQFQRSFVADFMLDYAWENSAVGYKMNPYEVEARQRESQTPAGSGPQVRPSLR